MKSRVFIGILRIVTSASLALAPHAASASPVQCAWFFKLFGSKKEREAVAPVLPSTNPAQTVKTLASAAVEAPSIIATPKNLNWGSRGPESVTPAERARIAHLAEEIERSLSSPRMFTEDNPRLVNLQRLFSNEKLLPRNPVIHIVGPGDAVDEWVVPLLLRKDATVVLSESDPYTLRLLTQTLRNENRLRTLWSQVQEHYGQLLRTSSIKDFDAFKTAVGRRLSLNDAFENTKYGRSQNVVRPAGGNEDVPLADLIIMNRPHLEDQFGPLSSAMTSAKGVKPMVDRQIKPDGILWIMTENLRLRVGSEFNSVPRISLPTDTAHFGHQNTVRLEDHLAVIEPPIFENVLFFPGASK